MVVPPATCVSAAATPVAASETTSTVVTMGFGRLLEVRTSAAISFNVYTLPMVATVLGVP